MKDALSLGKGNNNSAKDGITHTAVTIKQHSPTSGQPGVEEVKYRHKKGNSCAFMYFLKNCKCKYLFDSSL